MPVLREHSACYTLRRQAFNACVTACCFAGGLYSDGGERIAIKPRLTSRREIATSKQNQETLLSRHAAFWERAPDDGPLLHVARSDEETRYELRSLDLPLADGTVLSAQDEPLTPELIDPSLILDVLEFPRRQQSSGSGGPETVGDLLVTRAPLGKMACVEAILGCPVIPKLDKGSIYSAPCLDSPEELSKIPSLEQSPWLRPR